MVLILFCSLEASSDMRSWFFLSSPWAKASSLALRSALWKALEASPVRDWVEASSASSSRILPSSLAMAVMPPLRAAFSASDSLPSSSPRALLREFLPVERADMLLLSAELISQPGGINHSLLGLLLTILGSNKHTVNLSLEGVDAGLKLALA